MEYTAVIAPSREFYQRYKQFMSPMQRMTARVSKKETLVNICPERDDMQTLGWIFDNVEFLNEEPAAYPQELWKRMKSLELACKLRVGIGDKRVEIIKIPYLDFVEGEDLVSVFKKNGAQVKAPNFLDVAREAGPRIDAVEAVFKKLRNIIQPNTGWGLEIKSDDSLGVVIVHQWII